MRATPRALVAADVRRLVTGFVFPLAFLAPAHAAVPLHDRLSCLDCGPGANPHAPRFGGDSDFEPDSTAAALRRLGVDFAKSRPLPGSAGRTLAPPPADSSAPTVAPDASSKSDALAAPPSAAADASATLAPTPDSRPAPKPAAAKPPATVSGYTVVSFAELAGFALPELGTKQPLADGTAPPDILAQLPELVRRLDGKKILVTGFMLATKLDDGLATEFFLLSSPLACCFGTTPAAHEWIRVKMRKEGLPAVQHVPMPLAGRLRLRPQWDAGYLTALYEIEGDGLLKPKS